MQLVEFSLRRRVTISMVAVAMALFGLVAFGRLSINLLPDLTYPSLTVETRLPGAAPSEVEALVSRPIEEVVGIVAGVNRLTSVSKPGLSQVTLEFDWGRDMGFASIDVRQKLDLIRLPREAGKPVIQRFDPANDPVVRLYVTGGADLYQLRYVAEEVLKKDLESTEGVAAIKVNGGYEEEIQVRVDEGKLALLGLSIQDVNQRLLRENVNQAGGSLYEEEARYLVRANNEFEGLDDIMETVVVSQHGRQVRVRDIAEVRRGHKQRDVITRFGGAEAVELAMYKEGDANTVQAARAIHNRLGRITRELPEGIEVITGVDQSEFIQASIDEVLMNALLGGAIAILVLLLFLKDPRTTLIIGVSIPISIVATFFLMYRTGTTLNIMSLGGLALGVGMLVDNAIVVLEAIFKHREAGKGAFEAARDGASEVGRAVAASTLTTVAVFLPVVFLEGIASQLIRDMALTVSFSLLASLAVALTLIPMLAALMGGKPAPIPVDDPGASKMRRFFRFVFVKIPAWVLFGLRWALRWVGRGLALVALPVTAVFDRMMAALADLYPRILRRSLAARPLVLAVALLALAGAVWMVPRLGFDLIPTFSQGEFYFAVELPEGTPLEASDGFIADVESALSGDQRVDSYSSIIGGRGLSLTNTGTEGENSARITVRMASGTTPDDELAVASLLRQRLERTGLARFEFERPTYFSFRTPIEVEVYSDSLPELYEASAAVRERIERIPGIVDIQSSAELGNPELQIHFDRNQLAQLGLNLGDVAETVRNNVQGEVATRFTEGDREIDIVVRSVELGRASVDDVQDFIVGQRDGVPIYLKSVADVELAEGPSEIRRIGQKRTGVISGNLEGRDMGSAAADVRAALTEVPLPGGVTAALSGQEEERAAAQRSLLMAMALAVFLVYLVMASQFESFVHPFVIIFSLPLGAIGVIAALGLTGMAKVEALLAAGSDRLRPILMTSATTILGLTPMALGLGEGAELRAPLAITVIGGLTVATLLTLIVIPVVYSMVDRHEEVRDRLAERMRKGHEADDIVTGPVGEVT
jgi:HAE1 family hydrophobic/amphiphilic exporter-1